jgi:hypothetical protein
LVASGGKLIGENVVKDVKAIELLLKAERPDMYGDKRRIEIAGQVTFSQPEVTIVLAQVRSVLREPLDLPALPAAADLIQEAVIDGVVVDESTVDEVSPSPVDDQSTTSEEE